MDAPLMPNIKGVEDNHGIQKDIQCIPRNWTKPHTQMNQVEEDVDKLKKKKTNYLPLTF